MQANAGTEIEGEAQNTDTRNKQDTQQHDTLDTSQENSELSSATISPSAKLGVVDERPISPGGANMESPNISELDHEKSEGSTQASHSQVQSAGTALSHSQPTEYTILTMSGLIEKRPISSVGTITSTAAESNINSEPEISGTNTLNSELETEEAPTADTLPSTLYINSADLTVKEEPLDFDSSEIPPTVDERERNKAAILKLRKEKSTLTKQRDDIDMTMQSRMNREKTIKDIDEMIEVLAQKEQYDVIQGGVKEEPVSPGPYGDMGGESNSQEISSHASHGDGEVDMTLTSRVERLRALKQSEIDFGAQGTVVTGGGVIDIIRVKKSAMKPGGASDVTQITQNDTIDMTMQSRVDRLYVQKQLEKNARTSEKPAVLAGTDKIGSVVWKSVDSSGHTLAESLSLGQVSLDKGSTMSGEVRTDGNESNEAPYEEAGSQETTTGSTPLEILPVTIKDEPISPVIQGDLQFEFHTNTAPTVQIERDTHEDAESTQQSETPNEPTSVGQFGVAVKDEPHSDDESENWERVDAPKVYSNAPHDIDAQTQAYDAKIARERQSAKTGKRKRKRFTDRLEDSDLSECSGDDDSDSDYVPSDEELRSADDECSITGEMGLVQGLACTGVGLYRGFFMW